MLLHPTHLVNCEKTIFDKNNNKCDMMYLKLEKTLKYLTIQESL